MARLGILQGMMERPALQLDPEYVARVVAAALAEDIGPGDVTTLATIPPTATCEAQLCSRQAGIVAGLPLAIEAFRQLDATLKIESARLDGEPIAPDDLLLTITGRARPVLTAERVALNFVQRLSGIATLTARYVEAVRGTGATIIDTRKTTPGLRQLEKYAVRAGGAHNHRFGLFDGVLIKDNHIAASPDGIGGAVLAARRGAPHSLRIQVETETLDQVREALEAGADAILLDNMAPERLKEAVAIIGGRALVEASGGITLANVRAVAETGVDLISIGALTHSSPSLDLGLDFVITPHDRSSPSHKGEGPRG
ncbi:MAG TPA: carboxylating nicotinate-nucleotide diphosphorylase [Chloroflexota bacterium]|nr:carboxylating nicotinate-nucleotide diphosphorylase [Chloroflexota bacterium]